MSQGRFNLSALAVRERAITLFLIILITVAGVLSFFELGRAEDPPFTVKQMTIISAWPGATAQEMQDQVAEPLEKRLQELRWYDRSETYTRPGLAFTMLSLQDKTPPSQVQDEFYQARKKLGDESRKSACRGHRADDQRRVLRRDLCTAGAEGKRGAAAPAGS
ncbi:RND transporter, hydrophobe/amphiphile efflux-1 (HAE1) family [Pantoea agglomerans]|uniref:RND transporter, hydrophobe/amphiphile efflux-1 (HAE1) family n=1 Tax=Enterobacter agglomerans TaxID=549 RepID=A0A379AET6_ENTAG|nr:RND transporter, hydrophobe/amphiphile efflux-1 (HAE1) family [Pantoea agglomerans]